MLARNPLRQGRDAWYGPELIVTSCGQGNYSARGWRGKLFGKLAGAERMSGQGVAVLAVDRDVQFC